MFAKTTPLFLRHCHFCFLPHFSFIFTVYYRDIQGLAAPGSDKMLSIDLSRVLFLFLALAIYSTTLQRMLSRSEESSVQNDHSLDVNLYMVLGRVSETKPACHCR